jgi:hypothetical protein
MGWASGSMLAEDVWEIVRPHVACGQRRKVARKIWEAFESMDCDTLDEAEQLQKDAGYDYFEFYKMDDNEDECNKFNCHQKAEYIGSLTESRTVQTCSKHVDDLENYEEIGE